MSGRVYADGPQRRQAVTETTIRYDDRHIHRRVSRIIAIVAAQMHVSQAGAAKRFDQLQARATQTKNQAIETAESVATKTADTASTGSYLIFGVLLLDLITAAIGGSLAVQRRTLLAQRIVR